MIMTVEFTTQHLCRIKLWNNEGLFDVAEGDCPRTVFQHITHNVTETIVLMVDGEPVYPDAASLEEAVECYIHEMANPDYMEAR